MTVSKRQAGYLTFTLHAHLPYVIHHGTWPHGLEWLLEVAAETYLPLLRMLGDLERDGIVLKCNLNLSPILLEQLAHPVFRAEFPKYLERKINSAREDEAYFLQSGEQHFVATARYWQQYFSQAREEFASLGGDITAGFRKYNDAGLIEIITCAATHGYMPLLGTDESVRAQVRVGVATHKKHIGRHPRGMWVPECGYRPAGLWHYPVIPSEATGMWEPFKRIGIEQALGESEIDYFFVDTHLVEESEGIPGPYELLTGQVSRDAELAMLMRRPHRSLYQPYYVSGPFAATRPVTIFPRDPRTGVQVWSGDSGYPGDSNYLDFHKKRWPGGHRYWQVTGSGVDMAFKTPYNPEAALERVRTHAHHYVGLVYDALKTGLNDAVPPILTSPFDAELFGHWWFEGVLWLEQVARTIAREDLPMEMITCSEYLDKYPRAGYLSLHEGSWGKNGNNDAWLNAETSWTWAHIYPAEATVRTIATEGRWHDNGLGERIFKQLCRELLLLESSDWQFLITTESARDYAEKRFLTHLDSFRTLEGMWSAFASDGTFSEEQEKQLQEIEEQDSIFAEIDPANWARQ
ncbi:MAG: glycoside hydrolase family 57 protein [Acidobacteriaceae bacterium]